jgi:hypothetical protein
VPPETRIGSIDASGSANESLRVSPDSKRVAYTVVAGTKQFVVVDGKEGKQYNGIINFGGGRIVFDSADSLHYLALKGTGIYLVQESIKR